MKREKKGIGTLEGVIVVIVIIAIVAGAGAFFFMGGDGDTTDGGPTDGDNEPINGDNETDISRSPKIGIIVPQSGTNSTYSVVEDAYRMAINDYGPIDDYEVEVLVRDDASEVSTATTKVRELIEQKNIDLLAGYFPSDMNDQLATMCDRAEVPFINTSASSFMAGVENNPHPYAFKASIPIHASAGVAVEAAREYGSNVWLGASDYVYGHDLVNTTKKMFEGEMGDSANIMETSYASFGADDFSSIISDMKGGNPDTVIFQYVPTNSLFVEQADGLGLKDTAHIHHWMGERLEYTAIGDVGEGVTGATPIIIRDSPVEKSEQWAQSFKDEYERFPSKIEADSYVAMYMMLMAMDQAGTLDGNEVMETAEGMHWEDSIMGEPTYFRAANHQLIVPVHLVEWTPTDDEYAPGYFKHVKTLENPEEFAIPLDQTARYDQPPYE